MLIPPDLLAWDDEAEDDEAEACIQNRSHLLFESRLAGKL